MFSRGAEIFSSAFSTYMSHFCRNDHRASHSFNFHMNFPIFRVSLEHVWQSTVCVMDKAVIPTRWAESEVVPFFPESSQLPGQEQNSRPMACNLLLGRYYRTPRGAVIDGYEVTVEWLLAEKSEEIWDKPTQFPLRISIEITRVEVRFSLKTRSRPGNNLKRLP
jgi:hypothetical protein